MISKRLLILFGAVLIAAVLSEPPRVGSQQNTPCANTQTDGKTDKELQMADCSCEQSAAPDKPTYRVGAAPFGRKAPPRVGRSARRGASRGRKRYEPKNLYDGLEVPDPKDLRSPEVVGLREKVLTAREEWRQKVEANWKRLHDTLQRKPDNKFASEKLKDRIFLKAYERFTALQKSGEWVSWPKFDWREQGLDMGSVMDQGACHSCWAFAAVSVYQSNWNLEQMRLGAEYFEEFLPGQDYWYRRIPSVQQLLNCIGEERGDCESGGWHGTAFAFMVSSHVPHIPDRKVWKKAKELGSKNTRAGTRLAPTACAAARLNAAAQMCCRSKAPIPATDCQPTATEYSQPMTARWRGATSTSRSPMNCPQSPSSNAL